MGKLTQAAKCGEARRGRALSIGKFRPDLITASFWRVRHPERFSAPGLVQQADGSGEGLLQFTHKAWTDALGRRLLYGIWLGSLPVHFLSINPRNSVIRG